MNQLLRLTVISALLLSSAAWAGGDGAIKSALTAQQGKRVTVQLQSGQELTGIVKSVDGDAVKLGELAGKEFFDATIRIEAVDAVIARVKDK